MAALGYQPSADPTVNSLERVGELRLRVLGDRGPLVVVLHGGPGAPGSAASLASGLAPYFRVLEPWQRSSGSERQTVACHVADLHHLIELRCQASRPALVGESWGAMLALAYAAEHPDHVGALALVGCGTFDPAARAQLNSALEARMGDALRDELARVQRECSGLDRLQRRYALTEQLYDFDILPSADEFDFARFDLKAHTETWNDMLRLQSLGVYPSAFRAIRSPVVMLHGSHDPHPGARIRASLLSHIPQLEYQEWERCGHRPWLERWVRDEFFSLLSQWLLRHIGPR